LPQSIARCRAACIAARRRAIVDHRAVAPAGVLIVDDDPDIRSLVTYRLTASGYEVIRADDGEAGLAAAREHAPDLVHRRVHHQAVQPARARHAHPGHPLAQQVAAA
jgi:PleD family two-component response regulator